MNDLLIQSFQETPYFPEIRCDYDTAECRISGESYMEDARKFYSPVTEWIRKTAETKREVRLFIRLIYFNTSTSRILLQLLKMLAGFKEQGINVQVEWAYPQDDPDLKNDIEDLCREAGIEANLYPM